MTSFWKLMRRVRGYKTNVTLGIVFNILLALFTIVSIPLIVPFFQILFDTVPTQTVEMRHSDDVTQFFVELIQQKGKQQALVIVCGLIVATFFFKNLFRYLSMYVMAPMRTGIVYDIRSELYEQYLHYPLSTINDARTGDFISRISADVQEIEFSILKTIEVIVKSPLIILGSIGYMVYLSPQLSVFVFGLLLFTVFVIGGVSRSLKRKSTTAQERLSNIVSQVEETITGSRIVKAFNAEAYLQQRFDGENKDYRSVITRLLRRQDLSSPLSEFLGVAIVAVLMYYGSYLVFQQRMLPEAFFAFIFAFYQVIEPAKSFSTAYYSIKKGTAAIDRIDHMMELQDERDSKQTVRKETFADAIDISNVSFAYSDGEDVLHDVSLQIKKGETIALVGPSGSGKSTLVDLILGYFKVTNGSISIDGVDINTIALKDLRGLTSLVSQHAILFNDTVTRNITFSQEKYSAKAVEKAARRAYAHEFISQLSEGYDTNIGDKGVKLSGGQRQRLTIARAVYADPEILVLDEATSALDSESEQFVQAALEQVMRDKTAIIIAHRLATIQHADRIIVMDDGKVIASGNHAELIKTSALYKKYVTMQTF